MAVYAVVDGNGLIINRIVLAKVADWTLVGGLSIVPETDQPLEIGGSNVGGKYTPPVQAPPPQKGTDTRPPLEKLADIGLSPADLKTMLGLP